MDRTVTMEVSLGSDEEKKPSSSGDIATLKQTVEESLDDPRVQGVISTYLDDRGVDPTRYGFPDISEEAPEGEDGDEGLNAEKLAFFLGKAGEFLGEDTTVAELKEMAENSPEQANNLIEQFGL